MQLERVSKRYNNSPQGSYPQLPGSSSQEFVQISSNQLDCIQFNWWKNLMVAYRVWCIRFICLVKENKWNTIFRLSEVYGKLPTCRRRKLPCWPKCCSCSITGRASIMPIVATFFLELAKNCLFDGYFLFLGFGASLSIFKAFYITTD